MTLAEQVFRACGVTLGVACTAGIVGAIAMMLIKGFRSVLL